MRILITGGEGQLGRAVERALHGTHEVTALGRAVLDVTAPAVVSERLASSRPDVVVHCAAMTDTAACERWPTAAEEVNAHGLENVACACAAAGARLVAISTNEVFDGAASAPYDEDAEPRPVNEYGRSKLLGEQLARVALADRIIVRTSWLYEPRGAFVGKVLAAARDGERLGFVTDEIATPTYVADLASAIGQLIETRAPAGVYHLTNEGEASRYEWALEIVRLAGIGSARIDPITTAELRAGGYEGPVKPPYSVLANNRARALGIVLPDWREALARSFASVTSPSDA